MRLQHVLFLLALSLTLPGCAMREPLTPAVSEPEAVPLAVSFTEQVATFPEGATQYFAESPFGPVTIEAGGVYIFGLGDKNRSGRVTGGSASKRFAVCREENGTWRFIPTIFESMP